MMNSVILIGAGLHLAALLALTLYGLHRLWLLWRWRQLLRHPQVVPQWHGPLPLVTVQLPLYNEPCVVERLLDAVAALDWPPERLQIQVLDDSTDETTALVATRVAFWRERGLPFEILRRTRREGYKAGALAAGLTSAQGELIALFDADFVPPADFLRRLLPWFADPAVALVQARWEFLNSEASWLTRLQALLLGPHFGIEHQVRYRRGLFFNFNGTAGIWRRQAIEDAGGWQADTVTEDLDLSYRAQLRGWRFVYVDALAVSSELPDSLAAFCSQQQRWAKGSLQTARKILPRIWRATLPRPVKIEATAHLLANLGWLCGTLVALTVLPAVLWRLQADSYRFWPLDLTLFLLATGAILTYFFCHAWQRRQWSLLPFVPLIPLLTLGLAPRLAWAALTGLVRRGGEFVRTPKQGSAADWQRLLPAGPGRAWLPLGLGLYSLVPLLLAWRQLSAPGLFLLLFFPTGFFWLALQHGREEQHRRQPVARIRS